MKMPPTPHELQSRLRLFVDTERDLAVNVYGSAGALRSLANRLLHETSVNSEPGPGAGAVPLFRVSSDHPWSYPAHMEICFHLEAPEEGRWTYEHFTKRASLATPVSYSLVTLAIVGAVSVAYHLWRIAFSQETRSK